MNNIIIRVNAGKKIGYGHYYRCISLAKAFKYVNEKINIKFFINRELEELIKLEGFDYNVVELYELKDLETSDLFILDSYDFNDEYLLKIKKYTKLMLIDDNNDIYDSKIPDILYNGNIFAEDLNYEEVPKQVKYIGRKYLILKEEYWKKPVIRKKSIDILITTGGSDTNKVGINLLRKLGEKKDLIVGYIIGPGYPKSYIENIEKAKKENQILIYRPKSLKKYIEKSKVVISSSGSTVYEVLSLDSKLIPFSCAENQDRLYETLIKIGIQGLGKYPNIDYSILGNIKFSEMQKKEELKVYNNSTINLAKEILELKSI